MAKLLHTDSRRMYSWWWDSHISPKNSKWLHENLTDMDVKVKAMIKLLEVDEDSFARRAEMYYKKRPELLKMVEEFYRAYRALAEKYDHASGLIRHAHRTMSEAFPDQVAMMFVDESPASTVSRVDSGTPDLPTPMGQFTDESGNGTTTKTPKPFYNSFGPLEQVRRGLNFEESEDKEESVYSNGKNHADDLKSSKSDRESNSTERANSAEIEAESLKSELDKIAVEKDAALDQCMQSLEIISSLESQIRPAEEDLSGFRKSAESTESEVESLRQVVSKLTEEKETVALQYQQCLETISSLEQKLTLANEEAKRLNGEKENQVFKLQKAEEQCLMLEISNLSLYSELESLMSKMGTQSQELAEKQKELEQSCQSLMTEKSTILDEKATLMTQLQETNTNLEKVSDNNTVLLNSLSDAHHQLEALKAKSHSLEDSCQLHVNEKAGLITEKDILTTQLEKTQTRLAYFEKLHGELEGRCEHLENEKESILHKVEELQMLLVVECQRRDTELGNVLDSAIISEIEFKVVATARDQLSIEIKNAKEVLHQMAQELQEAEDKIILAEKKELDLNKSVEDLRTEFNDVIVVRDDQENRILKLSANNDCLREENNKRKLQEENLPLELENKTIEINDLENGAASLFGKLQHSMITQLLYEQKFYELHDACLGYIDQNEGLRTQLAAFGPEIASLKECISTLEDQTAIHIKFQNPESEEVQGSEGTSNPPERILNEDEKVLKQVSDLHDLRVRLEAIVKAAVEIKELMVHENTGLQAKLDESTRQIELLQSENGNHGRNMRPTSSNTEEDDALLTKDIVLDQISDGSFRYSKKGPAGLDNEIVELWETPDPDGKSNEIVSPTISFHRSGSTTKQKGEDLSVDKLEISKRFTDSSREVNKTKILQRLDSDVQKLANLQITVRDLKTKLELTEKDARGKAVIECEKLKGQLEEADTSVTKLFHLNGRLMKSVDESSFSDKQPSFDFEGEDGAKKRRVSEKARRMSENIGRLQLEVQNLQFALLKLDDEKEGRSRRSETKQRVVLRDYLYGGERTSQRRRKSQFFACVQPSTVDD